LASASALSSALAPARRPVRPVERVLARTLLEETGLLLRAPSLEVPAERRLARTLLEETDLLLRAPRPQAETLQLLQDLAAGMLAEARQEAAHQAVPVVYLVALTAVRQAALVRKAPAM